MSRLIIPPDTGQHSVDMQDLRLEVQMDAHIAHVVPLLKYLLY